VNEQSAPTAGNDAANYQTSSRSLIGLPLQAFLHDCIDRFGGIDDGHVADYIPELSKADPAGFGIALTTIDGHIHDAGDAAVEFTIQSVSKAFVYGMAIEFCGHASVAETIGVEPSGDSFNSIRLGPDNRPFNPMVNAGAIACSALIQAKDPSGAFERIQSCLSDFAGRDLTVDEDVYRSESETGDRNRAIAWLLRNNQVLRGDVDAALDVYFRQCALLVNARDLSVMGATLANNGVNPLTGRQVVSPLTAARTLSVMVSSGMYDYSGEWIYRVGLPAKSGVGGGIVAALPAQIGLGTYSPPLDELGNSVRGLKVCEEFSSHFGLHLLERQGDVKSAVAAEYDLAHVHSHRDRRPEDQEILERFGDSASILELAGALNFVSCDYISRKLLTGKYREIQIFDFRRVSGMSAAAAKLLSVMFEAMIDEGTRVIVTGLPDGSFTAQTLRRYAKEDVLDATRSFETLNDGAAWAEDQVIFTHGGFSQMSSEIDLREQSLLRDLTEAQVATLAAAAEMEEYRGGARIIQAGLPGDSVYFLTQGMVSVVLDSGVRVATLDAGTCFGELVLISRAEPRAANIISDSPSRCFRIRLDAIDKVSAEQPEIMEIILRNLASLLSERLRHANSKIDALAR